MEWLDRVISDVALAARLDPSALTLAEDTSREILDLARIASHASGDRINAPLLCYALGIAVGRGATLEEVAAAVRESAGETS